MASHAFVDTPFTDFTLFTTNHSPYCKCMSIFESVMSTIFNLHDCFPVCPTDVYFVHLVKTVYICDTFTVDGKRRRGPKNNNDKLKIRTKHNPSKCQTTKDKTTTVGWSMMEGFWLIKIRLVRSNYAYITSR